MQPDIQHRFSDGLLDPDVMPTGVVDPDGRPAPRRFNVYRNNVVTSLIEALGATYPAIKAIVGTDFFNGMAGEFVRKSPPRSPLLIEYGEDFADFVAGFAPAKGLPFLKDLARLEWAWLSAYHAADAGVVDPSVLTGRDHGELLKARFKAHPATRLVHSNYPITGIWRAGREGLDAVDSPGQGAEVGLVTRPRYQVSVTVLTSAQGVLFEMLCDGRNLGDATDAVLGQSEDFDLSAALGLVFSSGAMTGVMFKREGEV